MSIDALNALTDRVAFDQPDQVCRSIPEGHPFVPHIERFRAELRRWQDSGILQPQRGETMHTRTLMRANSHLEPAWIYRSIQFRTESSFRAWTLLYRCDTGRTSVYEFPDDPKLRRLRAYLAPITQRRESQSITTGIQVLRYVPRRRFTFSVSPERMPGAPADAVGKVVRSSETEELHRKLTRLGREAGNVRFAIAAMRDFDPANDLFFQERQPGTVLSDAIRADNFQSHLKQAGEIHAEIHSLKLLPGAQWNPADFVQRAQRNFRWISSFCPDRQPLLDQTCRNWVKRAPVFDPGNFVFCHGDFRTPHLLVNKDEKWAVVDFDGYLRADPAWEMAWFLSMLKRDVPLITTTFAAPDGGSRWVSKQAESSYLDGYRSVRGFSAERLAWFRLAMEIHYLARSFQRDLVNEPIMERTFEEVRQLATQFE